MKRIHLIASIIIVISSCYKDVPPPGTSALKQFYLLPQSVKDYAAFMPGTYWIYRDSVTGQIDSQYVTQCQTGIDTLVKNSANGVTYYEWLMVNVNSTVDTSNYLYFITMVNSKDGKSVFGLENKDYFNSTELQSYLTQTNYLIYPYTMYTNIYGQDTNTIHNVLNYASYTINGQNFNNVVKVFDSNNPNYGYQPENHYIADHMGIIRRELLGTHHTWNLIRYHIVQ